MVSVIIFVFFNVNFVVIQTDIVISLSIEAASRKTVDGVMHNDPHARIKTTRR